MTFFKEYGTWAIASVNLIGLVVGWIVSTRRRKKLKNEVNQLEQLVNTSKASNELNAERNQVLKESVDSTKSLIETILSQSKSNHAIEEETLKFHKEQARLKKESEKVEARPRLKVDSAFSSPTNNELKINLSVNGPEVTITDIVPLNDSKIRFTYPKNRMFTLGQLIKISSAGFGDTIVNHEINFEIYFKDKLENNYKVKVHASPGRLPVLSEPIELV